MTFDRPSFMYQYLYYFEDILFWLREQYSSLLVLKNRTSNCISQNLVILHSIPELEMCREIRMLYVSLNSFDKPMTYKLPRYKMKISTHFQLSSSSNFTFVGGYVPLFSCQVNLTN